MTCAVKGSCVALAKVHHRTLLVSVFAHLRQVNLLTTEVALSHATEESSYFCSPQMEMEAA